MLVDLHVHTNLSPDSNVVPEQYLEAIAKHPMPLGAICFTEHRLFPDDAEIDRKYAELAERFGLHIF
jgi:histidinol phosphatase-like PHP family hydrolase